MMRRHALRRIALAGAAALLCAHAAVSAETMAPSFEVDPFWPKPLPNHWVLGSTIGVSVDSRDHVWIVHRPGSVDENFRGADLKPKVGRCCVVAPQVLELDPDGNVVGAWGGPGQGYEWPDSNHGITVDHRGNVWLAGNGPRDTQVLKFDGAGKFLLQIGKHGVHNGSNDVDNFWQPTKIWEDVSAGEMYIGDGYGNRRVIVIDTETGKYKRHWGAYGNKPSDEKVPIYNPKGSPS